MIFQVAEECVSLGLRAGGILFRNLRVGPASAELRREILQEIQALRGRFGSWASARSAWELLAFQSILRQVGVNPRKVQHSLEKLLSYAFKRGDLPTVNNLVDAYNLVSLRTLCSLGAHDFDQVAAPVKLQLLTGKEAFTPLGGTEPEPVRAGEFGYVDAGNRLLCRLDVLQADFSKVTPATVNALLIIESTRAHPDDLVKHAFIQAGQAIIGHCGGTGEMLGTI